MDTLKICIIDFEPFIFKNISFIFLCLCLCVGTCALVEVLMKALGIGSPGDGVTGGCEPPDTGVGNQTWVLCESSTSS